MYMIYDKNVIHNFIMSVYISQLPITCFCNVSCISIRVVIHFNTIICETSYTDFSHIYSICTYYNILYIIRYLFLYLILLTVALSIALGISQYLKRSTLKEIRNKCILFSVQTLVSLYLYLISNN